MAKSNEIVMEVVTDTKKLDTLIANVHATGKKYNLLAHKALVSALHHLASTGRAAAMNSLFDGLRPAYQTALKEFCRQQCGYTIETEKDGETVKTREFWLKHTNKEGWFIQAGKAKANRDEWINAPAQFLGKHFFEVTVEGKAPVTFDDQAVLQRLDNLIKLASKDDASVSSQLRDHLLQFRKTIAA